MIMLEFERDAGPSPAEQRAPSQKSSCNDPARRERLNARAEERGYTINHVEAIRIAKTSGVVSVREIDLEDDHVWKVEGRDAEGREIEVELSARDGKVREVERN